jgi:hypothetical protein
MDRVPNVVHFCYGFRPGAEFGFLEYLAVRSARDVNAPDRICFHCGHEPPGRWWEDAKRLLTLVRVEPPTEAFGRRLCHHAHQADFMRVEILIRYGGIYLDIDTLCLRPFGKLRQHECVMGQQGDRGLCNAVILAAPGARFLLEWRESFRSFRSRGRDAYWDEHAVLVPGRLAQEGHLRNHIHILGPRAFSYPLWHEMESLFESNDRGLFSGSYCVNLWSTLTQERWLSRVTPEYVRDVDFFPEETRKFHGTPIKNLGVIATKPPA